MSDSTVIDVNKLKVVELRKELKSRGLSYAGDKAELVSRLQAALTQDEHSDINFEFDEMDSDGAFEDEVKSQTDVLDDSAVDTLNEDLVLAEQPPAATLTVETKPPRILKRKITTETKDKSAEKDASAKKIVLNRATNILLVSTNPTDELTEEKSPESLEQKSVSESNVIKINTDLDPKKRLELRAKRFGLPVKISDTERKEARKQRFNQNSNAFSSTGTLNENIDKLKKRAERFGESVSKIMTDIELKEKLEKRKAKFGA